MVFILKSGLNSQHNKIKQSTELTPKCNNYLLSFLYLQLEVLLVNHCNCFATEYLDSDAQASWKQFYFSSFNNLYSWGKRMRDETKWGK